MYPTTTTLVFNLKGNRDCVRGADLFNKTLAQFNSSDIRNLKFTIHGFIRNADCELHLFTKEPKSYSGKFRGSLDLMGNRLWLEVVESNVRNGLPEKVEFNEGLVTDLCGISGSTISLNGISPFSFIETVVPMNKHLLNTVNPSSEGRWIFTGLELDRYEEINSELGLTIIHNFQNKLVKTSVNYAGNEIGNIYFSLVKL